MLKQALPGDRVLLCVLPEVLAWCQNSVLSTLVRHGDAFGQGLTFRRSQVGSGEQSLPGGLPCAHWGGGG